MLFIEDASFVGIRIATLLTEQLVRESTPTRTLHRCPEGLPNEREATPFIGIMLDFQTRITAQ
jgi:hypothetical protein